MSSTSSKASGLAKKIESIIESGDDSNISNIINDITFSSMGDDDGSTMDETIGINTTNDNLSESKYSTVSSTVSRSRKSYKGCGFDDARSSFSTSRAHSEIDQSPEIESFISAFNAKYDAHIRNLPQALEHFDLLYEKFTENSLPQKNKNKNESIHKNTQEDDALLIQSLQTQVSADERKIKSLQSRLDEANKKIEETEKMVAETRVRSSSTFEQNSSLQKDVVNLQSALNQLHEVIEMQLKDLNKLSNERSALVEITQKQNTLIAKLDTIKNEKVFIKAQEQKPQTPAYNKPRITENNDFTYTLLGSIIRILDDKLPAFVSEGIRKIRDDSSSPVRERVLTIVQALSDVIKQQIAAQEQHIVQINSSKVENDRYYTKCRELLSLFEEELMFLQTLSRSSDLQSTVLCRNKTSTQNDMSNEFKQQLLLRCAQLSKFIDDTLGKISEEKFRESFHAPREYEPTRVFDLMNHHSMEDQLSVVADRVQNSDNIECREVLDLFAAQLYINHLLKSHISELHLRIANSNHEASKLRQALENTRFDEDKNRTDKKQLQTMTKRDEKIRDYISRFIKVDDEIPTINLVKQLVKTTAAAAQSQLSSASHTEAKDEEIRQLKNDNSELVRAVKKEKKARKNLLAALETSKKQLDESAKRHKSDSDQLKDQINNLQEKIKCREDQIEILQKEANTQTERKNEFDMALTTLKDNHQLELSEYSRKLTIANNKITKLSHQIEESEIIVNKIKRQRKSLGKQIERLQNANQMLTGALDAQTSRSKKQFNDTVTQLQSQHQSLLKDIEKANAKANEFQQKNSQLQQEITALTVAKKSAEFKLKAIEERQAIERHGLESQAAAKASVISAQQQAIIANYQKESDDATERLATLLVNDSSIPSGLKDTVTRVEAEFKNLRQTQTLYINLVEDISSAQKALNVSTPAEIYDAIQGLLSLKAGTYLKGEGPSAEKNLIREIDQLKREIKKNEGASVSLKQWEQWARRNYRIIHECESTSMSSSEIRLSLEEALLASVSHRSIFYTIESLRNQKKLISRLDRKILQSSRQLKPEIRSLMIIVFSIRRMQRAAGCLPIVAVDSKVDPTKFVTNNRIRLEDL